MSYLVLPPRHVLSMRGGTLIVLLSVLLWGGGRLVSEVQASVPQSFDLRSGETGAIAQSNSVLQFGDASNDVAEVQLLLTEFGYFDEPVSGFFGRATQMAVRQFQEDAGLEVNGRVDAETRRALFGRSTSSRRLFSSNEWLEFGDPVLVPGREDDKVRELQVALNQVGLGPIQEDGVYGNETASTVRRFQQRYGIDAPVFGQLDRRTALVLSGVLEGRIRRAEFPVELRPGDFGFEVRELQRVLSETRNPQGSAYFTGPLTGLYADITENAVRAYQRDNGLEASGVATERTLNRLFANHRYVVVVPFRHNRPRLGEMNRVRSAIARLDDLPGLRPQALRFFDDQRGPYIDAGRYLDREAAEARVSALRERGLMNARVEHFQNPLNRMRLSQADLGPR
ncbi:peptidoglycan-binding domain-containing protein [Sodalinema gerasimenkoae]|uniref:peptidoglycan-binding domain-containing protein n=1 Tax=Sodalinema gerasimenkoae TaxID=2862348 RepID=UPI0013570128|nr:peptidoglycan-binding protein [Sodalinema gerasimenkoae]